MVKKERESMNRDEVDQKAIGFRLCQAREYVGFTQGQVAKFLGLHRPSVTEIEAGRRRVTALELKKLSKLYRRSLDYLLHGPEATKVSDSMQAAIDRAGIDVPLCPEDRQELLAFADFLRDRKAAGVSKKLESRRENQS